MLRNAKVWVVVAGFMGAFSTGCGPDRGDGHIQPGERDASIQGPGPDLAIPEWDLSLGNQCGVQNFMLQQGLPPEVMIVLDRSGSMGTEFDSGTRWSKIAEAVKSSVASLQGGIGWGLTVFPVDDDCGTSANVDVTVATGNAPTIAMKIDAYAPGGNTPTAEAVKKATAYMASRTTPNPKYLLLSSDGEPNCGNITTSYECPLGGSLNAQNKCCTVLGCYDGLPVPHDDGLDAAVKAVKDAATQGIHTFVVGVASSGDTTGALEQLAVEGLEARPSSPKFYSADSQAAFVSAVSTIAGQIVSCSFALSSPPPSDPGLVEVSLNGTLVPLDATHANGWDFGPGQHSIQFYGQACTSLQAAGTSNVKAVYKCPPTL